VLLNLRLRARKGSRAPLTLLAPLALHEATGDAYTATAQAVLRGDADLT
jgi:tRNA1(Val) A37 N6-methylase TrmN6